MDPQNLDQSDELASLEAPSTVVEAPGSAPATPPPTPAEGFVAPAPDESPSSTPSAPAPKPRRRFPIRLNIYLLIFIILVLITGAASVILYIRSSAPTSSTLPQSLSQKTLDQLSNSDVTVGEPQHTLSVQSNAIFSGDVLVRSDLQIAGSLQVGSNLALAGLRVTGNATFDDVQITKSLALTGNGSIQGQLAIQQSLSVNGTGSFQGALSAPSLTVGAIQITGDLNLTHHISAGGSTPSRSYGSGIGSGGTASVTGSDTTGTVTINTGSGTSSGCMVTVTFATKFNNTPHISLTPVSAAAAASQYYATRTTSGFTICTADTPAATATLTFDYIALD